MPGPTVARVRGASVRLDVSLLLALPLFAWLMAGWLGDGQPDAAAWLGGGLLAAGLLMSVALHEGAHAAAAWRLGARVERVTLLPVGGASVLHGLPKDPRSQLRVALAGPLANLAFGGALLAVSLPAALAAGETAPTLLTFLGGLNVVLGAANLALPAYPMDGGRILRALLAPRVGPLRAVTFSARLGSATALLLGVWGILAGAWLLVAIAAFVHFGAQHEEQTAALSQALGRLRVGDLMTRTLMSVPAHGTVEMARERMAATRRAVLPVVEDGRPVGVVRQEDVAGVPAEERWWMPVRMVARGGFRTFTPWDDGQEAARVLGKGEAGLVVDKEGRLVGIVAGRDLAHVAHAWAGARPSAA